MALKLLAKDKMANLYFKKEKTPKEKAIKAIDKYIDAKCPEVTYLARFVSDDGGQLLELNLEVSDPGDLIDRAHPILCVRPLWMGWRSVIMKVPIGYIDSVLGRNSYD